MFNSPLPVAGKVTDYFQEQYPHALQAVFPLAALQPMP